MGGKKSDDRKNAINSLKKELGKVDAKEMIELIDRHKTHELKYAVNSLQTWLGACQLEPAVVEVIWDKADKALKLDNVSKKVPGQYIEASCEILGVIISTFYPPGVSHLPPRGKPLNR